MSIRLAIVEKGSIYITYQHVDPNKEKFFFIVSTVTTNHDKKHPVAGNREFGMYKKRDCGNCWVFYTKGVDAVYHLLDARAQQVTGAVFDGADALWKNAS